MNISKRIVAQAASLFRGAFTAKLAVLLVAGHLVAEDREPDRVAPMQKVHAKYGGILPICSSMRKTVICT